MFRNTAVCVKMLHLMDLTYCIRYYKNIFKFLKIIFFSKAKESKALPPLTPPGESGGAQGNPDLDIPGYAYNRNTHNLECLMLNLEKLYITDREEIRKILKLSDYGRLGNYVWKIFNGTNWSKVNSKGGYIISVLAREKRSTGS